MGAGGRRVAKTPEPTGTPEPSDTRTAPDPFTAVLPAIAALGAITSIAAINWAQQERTPDRPKARRKAGTALRDLETCCLGLAEIFRRFQRNPKLFAGEGAPASSPLKFGVHGPRVMQDGARLYQQLINDVASMLVLAAQGVFANRDVKTTDAATGAVRNPEDDYTGFNPRLGLIWGDEARASVFASVSRLFEAPTNFELEDDVRANEEKLVQVFLNLVINALQAMGGSGDPAKAPEYVQDRLAAKLYRQEGAAPWPNCA